jgi:serine/threonine protein phosphatase PrpC
MWRFSLPHVLAKMHSRQRIHPLHVPLLFAVATLVSLRPIKAATEAAAVPSKRRRDDCPSYGCPLLPQDIFYDEFVQRALLQIRSQPKSEAREKHEPLARLESSGNQDMATLTLIGYKGGPEEINQDRAFVVSPYFLTQTDDTCAAADDLSTRRLLGVFDGHSKLGEHVSQHSVSELPKRLAAKLEVIHQTAGLSEGMDIELTKRALIDSFVELDKTAPASISGGCTASVILQNGPKLYIANAGDSRSFIAVYRKSSRKTEIIYISREDKPHLPDERKRIEAMGGQVYVPSRPGATSRVLYIDPVTRNQYGLAMSRSIGDWDAGKLGVIPDPLVDVIDIPELIQTQMTKVAQCIVFDTLGEMTSEPCDKLQNDDVHIFAVSATDGMMDFVDAQTIASELAPSLFDEDGVHPLSACEKLISMAAMGWQRSKEGRYRDDIALSVSKIRTPPVS